jgi:hypothetical protein
MDHPIQGRTLDEHFTALSSPLFPGASASKKGSRLGLTDVIGGAVPKTG